jgi:ribosomal RNA-processing protein 9
MLYSSSADRTIKVWNIDDRAYVETLFGHQDVITCLDTSSLRERCLSTGGRDRTVRLWKIVEESQLVFRASLSRRGNDGDREDRNKRGIKTLPGKGAGDGGSLDVVCQIDDENWITGSDGGALSLWNVNKKKPVCTVASAHGTYTKSTFWSPYGTSETSDTTNDPENPHWISALTALPSTDLFASGSADGLVRLWQIHGDGSRGGFRSFECIASIPVVSSGPHGTLRE